MLLMLAFACGAPEPLPAAAPPPEPPPAPVAPPPPSSPGKIGGKPILPNPIILGAISPEAVATGIDAQRAALDTCWTALAEPRPRGKVAVRFSIDSSGVAHSARVHATSLRSPEVEACVLGVIDAARFEPLGPRGVAIVTYPLAFGVP